MRALRRTAVAAAVCLVVLPAPSWAGPQDVANEVAQRVMSPFCPGVTLHDCPSQAALDLRERIVGWAERGMSADQIVDRLEEQYGVGVRALPEPRGAGLGAWVLPVAAALAGLAAAAALGRRWSRRRPPAAPVVASEDERRALDAELDALRGRP